MSKTYYESAEAILQKINNREITVLELIERHLERIDEVNPALNAVITRCDDAAIDKAKEADKALAENKPVGPLHGLPFTIKDAFCTKGVRSTAGTKGLANHIPTTDATVVSRLRGAGAILIGKTNTPEITLAYDTDNLVFGRTNNPYDTALSPGGSSGGAAAIVATGGSAFDIGSDTGGSIRLPAHFCGIAGIKPTHGRVPRSGYIIPCGTPVDPMTQAGPMARYAGDLELILPVISGADWEDSSAHDIPLGHSADVRMENLKIAHYTDNGIHPASGEIEDVVHNALAIMRNHGAKLNEDRPDGIENSRNLFNSMFSTDGGAWARRVLEKCGSDEISPYLKWTDTKPESEQASAAKFTELMEEFESFRNSMMGFIKNYDAIICPVHAYYALDSDDLRSSEKSPAFSHCQTYNLTGWPVVVVRAGTAENGLPIGVQIVTKPWREDVGIAIARVIEKETGGFLPPDI